MNVVQPVLEPATRVMRLAVAGARGRVWIVDVANGMVIAASARAQRTGSQGSNAPAIVPESLIDVVGRRATARILDAAGDISPARTARLTLELDGRLEQKQAAVLLRVVQGHSGKSVGTAPRYIWVEIENAGTDAGDGAAIGFKQRTQAPPKRPPETMENVPSARRSPLSELPRPALDAADRATLDDIAQQIGTRANPAKVALPPIATADATRTTLPDAQAFDFNILAHELRTPIGAITTLAQILRPSCAPGARHYLDDIEMSARHALDVLAASHPDSETAETVCSTGRMAGVGSITLADTDLARIAGEVAKAVSPAAATKSIRVACYAEIGLPGIRTDARAIRQILFNLLTNAIKYSEPGSEITVVVESGAIGRPSIVVRDTGRGMTANDLKRVQSNAKTDGKLHYGLRIVRALTDALGASLTIDSKPGVGTRVTVSLPNTATAVPV